MAPRLVDPQQARSMGCALRDVQAACRVIQDFDPSRLLGLVGALALCGAYMAATRGWADPEGARYNLVNAFGASLLLTSLYLAPHDGAPLIEVLWFAIALTVVARLLSRRRNS